MVLVIFLYTTELSFSNQFTPAPFCHSREGGNLD